MKETENIILTGYFFDGVRMLLGLHKKEMSKSSSSAGGLLNPSNPSNLMGRDSSFGRFAGIDDLMSKA
jgi:hypothetical protein